MNLSIIVYLFVSLALFAVAVAVHVHNIDLSFPIPPAISIITILLPIFSFFTALTHPWLLRHSSASSRRVIHLAPFVVQTLQGLVVTILATLFFEGMTSSRGLDCKMETNWMDMFRAHDAGRIRGIQDALDCCGFNSVKDRAYPFPNGAPSTCAETYGRTIACRGPWRKAMQTSAGTEFAVVLVVGLMQVLGLVLMTKATYWRSTWRGRQVNGAYESQRPLLTSSSHTGGDRTRQDFRTQTYGSVNGLGGEINGENAGPRIEPSGISEHNEWNDE